MKASELKNKGIKFKLKDKRYKLKFDMNTFCELEEVYGDINQAFEDLQNKKIKALIRLDLFSEQFHAVERPILLKHIY